MKPEANWQASELIRTFLSRNRLWRDRSGVAAIEYWCSVKFFRKNTEEQRELFVEAGHELECDEDKERFEKRLGRIVNAAPAPKTESGAESIPFIEGTAWKHGVGFAPGNAGYGIKIESIEDRRRYFPRGTVTLVMGDIRCTANTDKKSSWDPRCGELIRAPIGQWFRSLGLIPWEDRQPPKFTLRPLSADVFAVELRGR